MLYLPSSYLTSQPHANELRTTQQPISFYPSFTPHQNIYSGPNTNRAPLIYHFLSTRMQNTYTFFVSRIGGGAGLESYSIARISYKWQFTFCYIFANVGYLQLSLLALLHCDRAYCARQPGNQPRNQQERVFSKSDRLDRHTHDTHLYYSLFTFDNNVWNDLFAQLSYLFNMYAFECQMMFYLRACLCL